MDKQQIRAGRERLVEALAPVLAAVREADPADPATGPALAEQFPVDGETMQGLKALVRQGIEEGWLAEREADGVRFSRVARPDHPATRPASIDVVNMRGPGPGHKHPNGEIDLCFAVSGDPQFDGHPEGWVVYGPGSWHVPTVSDGEMDILYFLPQGAIDFGPKPV